MLDELRHLILVVEHGTFTAAARHAHLSQPALTASIQRLEGWFDARLLDRGRHGASPTAAGDALLPAARAALAAVDDGHRAVQAVLGLETGAVRLGAGHTACTYFLPPALAAFRAAWPGIHIHLREGRTGDLRQAVDAGDLDLAVLTEDGVDPWRTDRLILVAAPDAPEDAPMVTFPQGSPTRALVDRLLPDVPVVMELGSLAAIKGHVRAGVGQALVSAVAVAEELVHGTLTERPHPATPIQRRLGLYHRGLDRLPPAAAALRLRLLGAR